MNRGTAFITQKGEKLNDIRKDIVQMELLLSGVKHASQSTHSLKKKKELREVDDALELMKDEYRKRMEACGDRQVRTCQHAPYSDAELQVQFEQKQARLREQVVKFEKFIHENDAKRQRAELKVRQERKVHEGKCKELAELQERRAEIDEEQTQLVEHLVQIKQYKGFLEKTIEVGGQDYEELQELLNRYDTLLVANHDLMKQVQEHDDRTDRLRQELQNYRLEQQNLLLVTASQVNEFQQTLERKRSEASKYTQVREADEHKTKEVVRESGQVVMAVKNIYTRCVTTMRHKQQPAQKDKEAGLCEQMLACLEVVHARISDLREIVEEYKQGNVAIQAANDESGLKESYTEGRYFTVSGRETLSAAKPSPKQMSVASHDVRAAQMQLSALA